MQRALRFSLMGFFLVVAAAGCTGTFIGPVPDLSGGDPGEAELGAAPEPSWPSAAAYLDSLFDPQQSLCREYPGATTFLVTPDNVLVASALTYLTSPASPDPMHGAMISARLHSLKACGCADEPGHDGFINHHIDPVVKKGALVPLAPRSPCVRTPRLVPTAASSCGDPGAQCPAAGVALTQSDYPEFGWFADACQATACNTTSVSGWDGEGQGVGAADMLALQILNRKNRGMDPMRLWQYLSSKWDGQGMRDRAAMTEGKYSTAKLALFKICARVLGQTLPEGVDRKLAAAQNAQGGIRSTYDLSGKFTLDQLGTAEATAYTILAFRKPTTDF